MRDTDVIVHLRRVESLLRERRYELALALTEILEEVLAALPDAESAVDRSVRDLLQASRLMTETLIRLRELRVH
jgi:hypothetical protein